MTLIPCGAPPTPPSRVGLSFWRALAPRGPVSFIVRSPAQGGPIHNALNPRAGMKYLLSFIYAAVAFSAIAIFLWRRVKKSENPVNLVFRWIITLACFSLCIYLTLTGAALAVPFLAVAIAVFLSVLWTPSIADLISGPFTSWYDGGNVEPELRPLYSIAEALRKR